jgi:hypothetical protein
MRLKINPSNVLGFKISVLLICPYFSASNNYTAKKIIVIYYVLAPNSSFRLQDIVKAGNIILIL